jgi:hypothetical protein
MLPPKFLPFIPVTSRREVVIKVIQETMYCFEKTLLALEFLWLKVGPISVGSVV